MAQHAQPQTRPRHPAVESVSGRADLAETALGLAWCAATTGVVVLAAVRWNRRSRDRRLILPHR